MTKCLWWTYIFTLCRKPYICFLVYFCRWVRFIFWPCPLFFLTTILPSWLKLCWPGWSLLIDDRLDRSGFLSILPPAVSPVYPWGQVLIFWSRGVKHQACWEGIAVSCCGVSPISQPCLWSAVARVATGMLTTFELWLLTKWKSLNCSLNSLA